AVPFTQPLSVLLSPLAVPFTLLFFVFLGRLMGLHLRALPIFALPPALFFAAQLYRFRALKIFTLVFLDARLTASPKTIRARPVTMKLGVRLSLAAFRAGLNVAHR